jgi:hypothetical protein
MAHTKRYKKSKSTRKRTLRTNASSSKKHQESYARIKKRNSIIRNIRMGHSTLNRLRGGGSYIRKDGYKCQRAGSLPEPAPPPVQEGGGYISQLVGYPWTVSNNPNTGNYFAPSPLGVGTGNVPKFEDGQPLNNGARWPTQLGPQLAKLGEMKGGANPRPPPIQPFNDMKGGGANSNPIHYEPTTEMKGGLIDPYGNGGSGSKKKRNQKTIQSLIRGGGVFDDIKGVYNNIVSSATNFGSRLEGVKPPPSSYAWDQPISRSSERI